MATEKKTAPLWLALMPVLVLAVTLTYAVVAFEAYAHLPIMGGGITAGVIGWRLGYRWSELQAGMVKGISLAMPAVLILLAIGVLIGSWIVSGVVPLLIVYGLDLLSAEMFLVAACLICAVVSLASGSSWTTASTVGVALMGVAGGLGVSPAMTAGAIVSGSYFGDKLSPLSDTTNLAAGVAEVPLFTHIRHMLWTTVPALLIAVSIYALLGRNAGTEVDTQQMKLLLETLHSQFTLTPWLLLAPGAVVLCLLFRMPALPAILVGAGVGAILAVTVQGTTAGELYNALQSKADPNTGVEAFDKLFKGKGGIESMFSTVGIILCALALGGLMECTGMLGVIGAAIMKFAINTGRLVGATLASCLGMNLVASDQYLAVVMPGRMYKDAFDEAGLDRRNLSRCLEDAGTITSPLIPWNSCGATMASVLVNPLSFLPFAFFNLLCPLISLLFGFTGWTMKKKEENGKSLGRAAVE